MKVVVLTAINKELEGILKYLTNIQPYQTKDTNTLYFKGNCINTNEQIEIVVGCTNQTNVNSAIETERVIKQFNPEYIFYIGIAGGIKDVKIGDIVIGEEAIGYERSKVTDNYLPRFQFGISSYSMIQHSLAFSKSQEWLIEKQQLQKKYTKFDLNIILGTIASGEKVIASSNSEQLKMIKKNLSNALAVEMEGLGFLKVCSTYPNIKSLLIRGISDLIDNKGQTDEQGSQEFVCDILGKFISTFLKYLPQEFTNENEVKKFEKEIFEILCKLYPRGLEDKGIWLRSGGDLSVVTLNTSARQQWIESIQLLKNGGGGEISFTKLLETINEDYNSEVIQNALHFCKFQKI